MSKIIVNPTECGYRIHEDYPACHVCNHPNTDGTNCINAHHFPGFCPLPESIPHKKGKLDPKTLAAFTPWECYLCYDSDKEYCMNVCPVVKNQPLSKSQLVARTCCNCAKSKWCQKVDITLTDCPNFKNNI